MTSVILGVLVLAASVFGLYTWWGEFILFLKGVMPASFLFASVIAIVAGISGLFSKDYDRLDIKNKK